MRGKAQIALISMIISRITPAYAGKSVEKYASNPKERDHPRLCGEKFSNCSSLRDVTGSPPPMRGKVSRAASGWFRSRITPAYAGKSQSAASQYRIYRDHPRLCGEKRCRSWTTTKTWGSPPPMRGKDQRRNPAERVRRITPAYAGKREAQHAAVGVSWDHPRLCGEKEQNAEPRDS